MVMLGRANSRMKDFYDVWTLAMATAFDNGRLAAAIAATFKRRRTDIPIGAPDALTADFANDPAKQQQWAAFVQGVGEEIPSLAETITQLAEFLMPIAAIARERSA